MDDKKVRMMTDIKTLKNNISNFDFEKTVSAWWKSIPAYSKKSFIWMFSIINIVFLWHTVTFFFGNHDWEHIKNGIGLFWSGFDGRWGAGVIQQLVGGDILPVVNNLFCFTGFCLAMIALAKYWRIPKTTMSYCVFGLFIMLLPYTYPWLQFVRSETHFWNIYLIILGLMLTDSAKTWQQLFSIPIFVFSIGCYGTTIEAMVSIFLGMLLSEAWFDYKNLTEFIKKHYKTVIYIAVSAVISGIIFKIGLSKGIISDLYTTRVADFGIIWQNIMELPESLKRTFFVAAPYMPSAFKIFLFMALPFSLVFAFSKKIGQIVLIVLISIALILSSQLIQIISIAPFTNQLRIDFFAVPYIYAAGWTIIMRQPKKIWRSVSLIMMICAIYYAGIQAVRDQKVKYFDWQSSMKIFDDVRSRIKANAKFSPEKKYRLVMMGNVYEASDITAFDHYNKKNSWINSWVPYVPGWNADYFFNFYEIEDFISLSYDKNGDLPLSDEILKTLDIWYLMNRAAPWPNSNSVYINEDVIYLVFSQKGLDEVKQRIINLYEEENK